VMDHLIQLEHRPWGVAQPTYPRSHAGSVRDRSSRYADWAETPSRL
jgi:hypothetical protein